MALSTLESQLRSLWKAVDEARQQARRAEEYAERSARMHHEAICRLNELVAGTYGWPEKS